MKLARYVGAGRIEICEEPSPLLPPGGLLVKAEASGLCSGELMDWYMDGKVPHVLGHEVAGTVVESDDERFPVGSRVAPHHHAPCMDCEFCFSDRYVHCSQWKRTRLVPGGMAEVFAVDKENLGDTLGVDHLRPIDAALIEPLGCVTKSLRHLGSPERAAVIGLGSMGVMHMLMLAEHDPVGIEISDSRREWSRKLGFRVESAARAEQFDSVVVCPGSQEALDAAFHMVRPGGRIVLFAPFPPAEEIRIDWNHLYFKEISLLPSYSCGPEDTVAALWALEAGQVKAEQVVSDFIEMDELPAAYLAMKRGEILKAMVVVS